MLPPITMITALMIITIITMAIITTTEKMIKMKIMKEEEEIIFRTSPITLKTKTKTIPIRTMFLFKIEIQKDDTVLICNRKALVFEVISVGIHMIKILLT